MTELSDSVKQAMAVAAQMKAAAGEATPEDRARKLQREKENLSSLLSSPDRIVLYSGTAFPTMEQVPATPVSEWFFPVAVLVDAMEQKTNSITKIAVTGAVRVPTEGKVPEDFDFLKPGCVHEAERALRMTVMRHASKTSFDELGKLVPEIEKDISSYPQLDMNKASFVISEMCMQKPKTFAELQAEAMAAAERFKVQQQQQGVPADSPLAKRFCTNCGSPAGISKFCTNCGAKIQ